MKKTILTILICGVMILGLTGCGNKNEFNVGEKSDVIVLEQDVSLTIKDGTLKNTDATLALTNNSDKLLMYSEYYEIEIKQGENWHKINVEISFNDSLWLMEKNSEVEIKINWKNTYGKLVSGEYRIIKEVYFENEFDDKFYILAEFSID